MTSTQHEPTSAPAAGPGEQEQRLGLVPATALVLGRIIGVGVLSLPSPASSGPPSLVATALTTVGALALLLAALNAGLPT